jgi:hypothetical protein
MPEPTNPVIDAASSSTIDAAVPIRVKRFVTYFKNYMGLSTLVTAALPIPITAFGVFPVYGAQKAMLGLYTSLFCFLFLAFIFYSRHSFANVMFKKTYDGMTTTAAGKLMPLLPILGAIISLWLYQDTLRESTRVARAQMFAAVIVKNGYDASDPRVVAAQEMVTVAANASMTNMSDVGERARRYLASVPGPGRPALADILAKSDADEIPFGSALIYLSLSVFVFAEAAFVIMALREYLQDLLQIDDLEIIRAA